MPAASRVATLFCLQNYTAIFKNCIRGYIYYLYVFDAKAQIMFFSCNKNNDYCLFLSFLYF